MSIPNSISPRIRAASPAFRTAGAFYINEAGNPVVVFQKYEIAPGSSGVLEFEIAG